MIKKTNRNETAVIFPNMGDYLDTMRARSARPAHTINDPSWSGARSLRDAVEIATNGWEYGRTIASETVAKLETTLREIAREMTPLMVHDVAGAYPDMGRYMEGEPECMVQYVQDPATTSGQVCRVLIDCGANAKHSADWMCKRAGAVTALVQVLAMVGKTVEVWIASPVTGNGKVHDTVVCVHNAGGTLNVDDIAFSLGHPAMLRAMIFECRYAEEIGGIKTAGSSYGEQLASTLEYLAPDLVVERAENDKTHAPDPARDPEGWVRHQLKRLGMLPA